MRFLGYFWALIGVWFLASALTTNGLLPGGHGPGRMWELLIGVIALGYGLYRIRKAPR